jgi:uncharacterized membrane protein YqgA involved in biofilm formation
MPIGTIINALLVIAGSILGVLIKNKLPQRVQDIVFDANGLITLAIGISMLLKMEDFIPILFSVVIGAIIGEFIKIEERLEKLAEAVKKKVKSKDARFTEGLVTAFLLFCVGPLTILGSFNEGLRNDRTLILTKGILDGFTSVVFTAAYGIGVAFSAIPLLIYQSALTLFASSLQGILTPFMINQFTAVGGILLLGIGINLLKLKHIRVANFLPSLVIIILLTLVLK